MIGASRPNNMKCNIVGMRGSPFGWPRTRMRGPMVIHFRAFQGGLFMSILCLRRSGWDRFSPLSTDTGKTGKPLIMNGLHGVVRALRGCRFRHFMPFKTSAPVTSWWVGSIPMHFRHNYLKSLALPFSFSFQIRYRIRESHDSLFE